ncbi:BON domain-containing protein [Tuwongella immobilis]|uniref:BON domain-containing protein n=1 Tax=Tuwongella immobilis TaxID=692036 RepID=A0A6C2YU13_9BACT|nr:BON domain-containing protein [Tuwongella immobilis]VIP04881.1 unnamed protein product [Tuwongella immobilis]VTS07121.1 unnamed protein product [Tuwongella immobilis]
MSRMSVLTQPASDLLQQSPLPALRRLMVTETECEVILTGCVYSYYHKQMAQETIRPGLGDRRLSNQIVVRRETITTATF